VTDAQGLFALFKKRNNFFRMNFQLFCLLSCPRGGVAVSKCLGSGAKVAKASVLTGFSLGLCGPAVFQHSDFFFPSPQSSDKEEKDMATAAPAVGYKPIVLVVNANLLALPGGRYCVETADSGNGALERLQRQPLPELVVMNLELPDNDGLQTLQRARELHPELKVIMLGAPDDARRAALAVRMGALEYLPQPVEDQELRKVLAQHLAEPGDVVQQHVDSEDAFAPRLGSTDTEIVELEDGVSFVCGSPAMKQIYVQAQLIAKFDMPVLMLGHSGTGKEVVSMLIHHLSPRAKYPFLKVNCAAVPADLLESELFGYEAGAFTGATKAKPGKFELCEKGTILLDEVGEMPPALQAKLLHFLQDHKFSRLGSRTTTQADVRILAATNINVEEALASKALREDLYYRLSGFTMRIPSLKDRRKEIPLLMNYFMKRGATQFSSPERRFSQNLLQACLSYSWPGNLRQLENFVRRYLVLGDEELAISELTASQRPTEPKPVLADPKNGYGLKSLARSVKKEAEAAAIAHALQQTNWHRQKAAALLSISYKALLYKIKQYDLNPPESGEFEASRPCQLP
jgi:DNA-binding NtrC family response regulator